MIYIVTREVYYYATGGTGDQRYAQTPVEKKGGNSEA